MFTCDIVHWQSTVVKAYSLSGWLASLSKTTKLILLDSLLQEVCINSGEDGSLTLSSLGLSVRLCQSQTFFIQG